MPSPKNSSTSSQATTSTTTNQDVANSGAGGIAIGAGASYINEFDPNVAAAVTNVIDRAFNFAGNSVAALGTNAAAAVAAAEQTANQAVNNSQLGTTSILTNPVVVFGAVAILGIIAFMSTRRK